MNRKDSWNLDRHTVSKIWRLVVYQALRDVATGGSVGLDAFDWVLSAHCEEVCDVLGIDYERVKKAACKLKRREARMPLVKSNIHSRGL